MKPLPKSLFLSTVLAHQTPDDVNHQHKFAPAISSYPRVLLQQTDKDGFNTPNSNVICRLSHDTSYAEARPSVWWAHSNRPFLDHQLRWGGEEYVLLVCYTKPGHPDALLNMDLWGPYNLKLTVLEHVCPHTAT